MSYKEANKNMFFRSALAVALLGFLLYFVEEIILWAKVVGMTNPQYGFRILTLICDGIMIIAILLVVIFLFLGKDKRTIIRLITLMGALYLLSYVLSLLFHPFWDYSNMDIISLYPGNILEFYSNTQGQSFISLLLTGAYCIYLIVITSISFRKDETTFVEKFSLILFLGLIFVFINSNIQWPRGYLLGSSFYGLFMIPLMVELILLIATIVLITLKLTNTDEKVTKILGIVFINMFFIAMISTTVISTGFTFDNNDVITFAIGNCLVILGAVLLVISSALKIKKEVS